MSGRRGATGHPCGVRTLRTPPHDAGAAEGYEPGGRPLPLLTAIQFDKISPVKRIDASLDLNAQRLQFQTHLPGASAAAHGERRVPLRLQSGILPLGRAFFDSIGR